MANIQLMQQQADAYNQQLGQYNKAATQFKFDADVYNKQLKEYQAIVDAYNAKLDVYNRDIGTPYQNQLNAYNTAVANYNAKIPDYQRQLQQAWDEREMWASQMNNWMGDAEFAQTVAELNAASQRYADLEASIAAAKPTAPAAPAAFTEQRPGDFTAVKPELNATLPKDPGFTGQQMKQLLGQKTVAQQEREGTGGDVGLIQQALGRKKQPDSIIGGMLQNVRYST